jgi:tetratricopeptide (TPR) repeat protein
MPIRFLLVSFSLAVSAVWLYADDQPRLNSVQPPVAHCGEIYAPPFENRSDAWSRQCDDHGVRSYRRRHSGFGFEILDLESEACFVPDDEYRLLDRLIDQVEAKVHYDSGVPDPAERMKQAAVISKTISDTMAENGFGLYIPTDTLSDALLNRASPDQPARYIFDCDTGSFIFLTISDSLKAPVSLVDITLPSGAGHNYVQWKLDDSNSMNWDMNGRAACLTPPSLPAYQGKAMSREQAMGYALSLRAEMWSKRQIYDRALADFRSAMKMYPEDPLSDNNFAWIISTRDMPNRKMLVAEALDAALKATSIANTANYMDTLACVYALKGDFPKALKVEIEALAKSPGNADYEARLSLFHRSADCTGAK